MQPYNLSYSTTLFYIRHASSYLIDNHYQFSKSDTVVCSLE